MTTDETNLKMNQDGCPECQPCEADKAAIEALVEQGWALDRVSEQHRARAERICSLLGGIGRGCSDEQSVARLVAKTAARLQQSAASVDYCLTPDDEEALDAWQLAEHRVARVPGSLRDRAAKIEAIGALLTSVPVGSQVSQTALVNSTMARLGSERTLKVARGSLSTTGGSLGRFKFSDLVSVAAMLMLGTAVIWPIVASGRSHMQQIACRSNLGDAATGLGLYSGDNRGELPMATASLGGSPWWDVGVPERSNSANLYTLAREKYTRPGVLACGGNPNCKTCESTGNERDWSNLKEVSYSFRIMFGGKNPAWHSPGNVVVLADKSPVVGRAILGQVVYPTENSPNHDGRGQNALNLDGSAKFMTTPITATGDNMWLPRGIELALNQAARSLKPGQSGIVEMQTWMGPNQMEPIKGIETPADENDSFVGP